MGNSRTFRQRRTPLIIAAIVALVYQSGDAWAAPALAKPDPTIANIPVTQFRTNTAPLMPTPLAGHAAIAGVFAIQSYSSSQQTPTSAPPGVQVCVNNGTCSQIVGCVNSPTWPSVSQSITWWQNQNQSLKGTYAWNVGSTYSHQDAEGWINHCTYKPQPSCPGGSGWTGSYSWVYPNWVDHCLYTPPPSCPTGAGWTGSYVWHYPNWVSNCRYTPPPACPSSAGWTGNYYWNGSSWIDGCSYTSQPSCPANYSGTYAWNGYSWVNACSPNACPTGAGWTGAYYPNCHYQPQPSCPSGYTGSYNWTGSSWADNCQKQKCPGSCYIAAYYLPQLCEQGSCWGGYEVPGHCYVYYGCGGRDICGDYIPYQSSGQCGH